MTGVADWRKPRTVATRSPGYAYVDGNPSRIDWRALDFNGPPNIAEALREHEAFSSLLQKHGIEVLELEGEGEGEGLTLDGIFCRDTHVVTPRGLVHCRMAKANRSEEPVVNTRALEMHGVMVAAEIKEPGCLEGGDVVWITDELCAVGVTQRTNESGVQQLQRFVAGTAEVIPVPLDLPRDHTHLMHLSSCLSTLAEKVFVFDPEYLPTQFRSLLRTMGIDLLPIVQHESSELACNLLALDQGIVCAVAGAPQTAARIRRAGFTVETYVGRHISLLTGGGPTCLTRPLEFC